MPLQHAAEFSWLAATIRDRLHKSCANVVCYHVEAREKTIRKTIAIEVDRNLQCPFNAKNLYAA